MGRGLSDLQKVILRRALSNRERESRGFDCESGADVFVNEIAADFFGWDLPSHYYNYPEWERWGTHYYSHRFPEEERNRVHAATSRALKRLQSRGLGTIIHGNRRWCGFDLTPEGVEAARLLSVNESVKCGSR
jgi:hypothetical protein